VPSADGAASDAASGAGTAGGDGITAGHSNPSGGGRADRPPVRVVPSTSALQPGAELSEVLAAEGVDAWLRLVDPWLRLIDAERADNPGAAVTVATHRMIVDDDGALHPAGADSTSPEVDRDRLVRRGVFWLAVRAAPLAPPERWAPARTVGDLMRELGTIAGLAPDGSWIEQTIVDETDLLSRAATGPRAGDRRLVGLESGIRGQVSERLTDLPLGEGLVDRAARLSAELAAARGAARKARAAAQAARADARAARDRAHTARAHIETARARAADARARAQAAAGQAATARAQAAAARQAAATARASTTAARSRAARARARAAAAEADLAATRRRLARSEAERSRLERQIAVRAVRRGRQIAARLAPVGSRRRRMAARLLPVGTRRRRWLDRVRGR